MLKIPGLACHLNSVVANLLEFLRMYTSEAETVLIILWHIRGEGRDRKSRKVWCLILQLGCKKRI